MNQSKRIKKQPLCSIIKMKLDQLIKKLIRGNSWIHKREGMYRLCQKLTYGSQPHSFSHFRAPINLGLGNVFCGLNPYICGRCMHAHHPKPMYVQTSESHNYHSRLFIFIF